MVNEFQIIVFATIVVSILVFFFVLKRSSTPQSHVEKSEKKRSEAAPERKEEPKTEPKPEISYHAKEEGSRVIAPAIEDTPKDLSRRKSDRTIQKRSVPEQGKITKQNFSEFAGERILVAEDNLINQKVISGLLAESGIELVMANDGQEALDILEHDPHFLMILMDAHMPRVDGFQATRIIRANPRYDHILVVALSGDTASDDIQKMKDAGMAEQLAKPLRMESLYKILYAYAGKRIHEDEVMEVAVTTKNLDFNKGLQTCGGDENFYREILSEFIADYADSPLKLGEFLRSHDMQAADAYLLDIIGVTANIGAHPLGEIASNIKAALGDTQEQSYFSLFDQYKVHMDRLMKDIRTYL